jgi:hypothetical protein
MKMNGKRGRTKKMEAASYLEYPRISGVTEENRENLRIARSSAKI